MTYSADVNYNGVTRVSFGMPAVASATAVINGQSIATAVTVQAANMALSVFPEVYGRNLTYVASGASTAIVVTDGYDYLGQPTSEQVTLNGATPVVGTKCFKAIRQMAFGATAATTVNVGVGTRFGLPYKALKVEWETSDGALVGTTGTLTAPDLSDPATAATGDPRGSFVPNTAPNGSRLITAAFDFVNDVNAANNGGLHGIAQFGN
jgi:hypothetical protein